MSYHKDFQRIGLAAALLITQMVGELLHPAPSEAVNAYVTRPTVTIQVDPCGGGKSFSIAGVTKANPGVVTTNGAHGFVNGDQIYIDCASGMTQVNGKLFSILNASGNSFSLGVDTSSYVAYVTGGSASKPISSFSISGITRANPGVVTTTAAHGFVTGDKIYLKGIGGMTQVNDLAFTITVLSTTTFSIGVNTSTYGTFTAGSGTAYQILTAPVTLNVTDCTDAELTALAQGFTSCFFLPNNVIVASAGNTRRYFRITEPNYPACATSGSCGRPILKINDTNGGMDGLVFSNYQFRAVKQDGTELTPPYWGITAPGPNGTTITDNKNNFGTPGSNPPYYGEAHTMRLAITHRFDYAGNTKSACTNYSDPKTCSDLYKLSLRIAGTFDGIISRGANFTGSGDYVKLAGIGYFGPPPAGNADRGWQNLLSPIPSGGSCSDPNSRPNPLDVKYCVLQRQIGPTANSPSSYSDSPDLVQDDLTIDRYPSYICDRAPTGTETVANSCKPQVVVTLTSTLRGPDTFIAANSLELAGGGCSQTNNKGGTLTPQGPPCFSNSKKNLTDTITTFFDKQHDNDVVYFASVGAEATPACQGNQCACSDPEMCAGTIVITADVTPAAVAAFPFTATGSGVDNFIINTSGSTANPPCPAKPLGGGCIALTGVTTLYGDGWVFSPDYGSTSALWPRASDQHRYDVDNADCKSALNVYVYDPANGQLDLTKSTIVSEWNIQKLNGLVTSATVTRLGVGDTVTCNFHIHKNASN